MKILNQDKTELMTISGLERDGDVLLIKGKVFGTMPMTARLTPEDARQGLKLLNFKLIVFLLTFLFKKSR